MTKYLGEFNTDKTKYPLIRDTKNDYYDGFNVDSMTAIEISQLNIIVAAYNQDSYDGNAFVLFEKDGKLYEVNDSHCSCSGLECWWPEETTKEALLLRNESYGIWSVYGDELREIIKALPYD